MNEAGKNLLRSFGPKALELKEIFQQFKIKQPVQSFSGSHSSNKKDSSSKGKSRSISTDLFQFLLQKFVFIHKYNNYFQKRSYIYREDQEDILNNQSDNHENNFDLEMNDQGIEIGEELNRSEQLNCYVVMDESQQPRQFSVKIIPTFIEQPSLLILIEDLKSRKQNKIFEKHQNKQMQIHNAFFSDIQTKIQTQMAHIIKNNLTWSKKMCIIIRNQLLSYYQCINQSFKLVAKAETFPVSKIQKYLEEYFPTVEIVLEDEQLKDEMITQDFHLVLYVLTCFFSSSEKNNNTIRKQSGNTNTMIDTLDQNATQNNIINLQKYSTNYQINASLNPFNEINNSPQLNSFYDNMGPLNSGANSNAINLASSIHNNILGNQNQNVNTAITITNINNNNILTTTNVNCGSAGNLNSNQYITQFNTNNNIISEKLIPLTANHNRANHFANQENTSNTNLSKNNSNHKANSLEKTALNKNAAAHMVIPTNEDNFNTLNNKSDDFTASEEQQEKEEQTEKKLPIQEDKQIIKCHIRRKKCKLYDSIVFTFENYSMLNTNHSFNYTRNDVINKWIYQQANKVTKYIGPNQIEQSINELSVELFSNINVLQGFKNTSLHLINCEDPQNKLLTSPNSNRLLDRNILSKSIGIVPSNISKKVNYQKSSTVNYENEQTNLVRKSPPSKPINNFNKSLDKDHLIANIPTTYREYNFLQTNRSQPSHRSKLSIDIDNLEGTTAQQVPSLCLFSQSGRNNNQPQSQVSLRDDKEKGNIKSQSPKTIRSEEQLSKSPMKSTTHFPSIHQKLHMQRYGKLLTHDIENERIVEVSLTDSNNLPSRHRTSTVTVRIEEGPSEGFPDNNIKTLVQNYS